MRTLSIFRGLVFGAILLLAARIVAAIFGPSVPDAVTTYLDQEGAGSLMTSFRGGPFTLKLAIGGLLIAYAVAYVASLVGMLKFHGWSRYMFIVTTIVGVALLAASGTAIHSAFQVTVATLGAMLDGALITLLCIDPVRARFRGVVEQEPVSTEPARSSESDLRPGS
jgi:hypothetical protein